MLTVAEATEAVLATVRDFGTETVDTQQAIGRILRESVYADRDYPPINRATMDGIAINRASWDSEQRSWMIEATIAAGAPGRQLADRLNGCVQIMTGADVPDNCDGVIPYEEISIEDNKAVALPEASFTAGQHVHVRSSDRKAGDLLLSDETWLTPPRIAIMASVGHVHARVAHLPRVAVVSTGSEIVPIDQKQIRPTDVRASNLVGIQSALHAIGIPDVTTEHIVDDFDTTTNRIVELIENNDVLILSGGVSKGKFDYVPAAFEKANVRKIFHRVAQRPGKPLWFGQCERCTIFGLPGNPVSTLTVFRRYVVPFLQKSSGIEPAGPEAVKLEGTIKSQEKLTLLYPVRLQPDRTSVHPVDYHGSGDFAALSESDGFIEIPPGSNEPNVDFWPW